MSAAGNSTYDAAFAPSERERHLFEIEEALARTVSRFWLGVLGLVLLCGPLLLGLLPPPRQAGAHAVSSFLAAKIRSFNPRCDAWGLARVIVMESAREGLDPFVVASMVQHESSFRIGALSTKGARGLMQILPSTAEYIARKRGIAWRGHAGLYEPQYNLRLGIAYLKYLYDAFDGDPQLVLMAYNWGPTNVRKLRREPGKLVSGVQRYTDGVLQTQRRWREEFRQYAL